MFVACEQVGMIAGQSRRRQYKVIDTDFEEVIAIQKVVHKDGSPNEEMAVIEVYERRNLPVAPNLWKAVVYLAGYVDETVVEVVAWNRIVNPHWHKYADVIDKYMMLA